MSTFKHRLSQCDHEKFNASHYPGTRQMCSICDKPTERCEDDEIVTIHGDPVCVDCYEELKNSNLFSEE
jgi:hypothetical protein